MRLKNDWRLVWLIAHALCVRLHRKLISQQILLSHRWSNSYSKSQKRSFNGCIRQAGAKLTASRDKVSGWTTLGWKKATAQDHQSRTALCCHFFKPRKSFLLHYDGVFVCGGSYSVVFFLWEQKVTDGGRCHFLVYDDFSVFKMSWR